MRELIIYSIIERKGYSASKLVSFVNYVYCKTVLSDRWVFLSALLMFQLVYQTWQLTQEPKYRTCSYKLHVGTFRTPSFRLHWFVVTPNVNNVRTLLSTKPTHVGICQSLKTVFTHCLLSDDSVWSGWRGWCGTYCIQYNCKIKLFFRNSFM